VTVTASATPSAVARCERVAGAGSLEGSGIDFNLRRSLVFARDTGINDGLRLRGRVAPEFHAFNTSGHIPIPRVAATGEAAYSPPCGFARCLRWHRLGRPL